MDDERTARPLGLLESTSIAAGLRALDACRKRAPIDLAWSRTLEPGRHVFLFTGEVDAVKAALQAGGQALGANLAGSLLLARPHASLLPALRAARPRGAAASAALGLVETRRIAPAVRGADAAVKGAQVELRRVRIAEGMGGKALVVLTGPSADVESAVALAAEVAEAEDALVRAECIDGPDPDTIAAALGL